MYDLRITAHLIGVPSTLPHLIILSQSTKLLLHASQSNLALVANLFSTTDNARITLTTFAILSMFDNTVIKTSKKILFINSLYIIQFNNSRRLDKLLKTLNNNVEQNPLKI